MSVRDWGVSPVDNMHSAATQHTPATAKTDHDMHAPALLETDAVGAARPGWQGRLHDRCQPRTVSVLRCVDTTALADMVRNWQLSAAAVLLLCCPLTPTVYLT